MTYQPLDETTIVDYIAARPALAGVFSDFCRFAQDLNVPTPAAAAIRENIKAAVNKGWGEQNASALIRNLEEQAGVVVKK